jgi:hypothetical protein
MSTRLPVERHRVLLKRSVRDGKRSSSVKKRQVPGLHSFDFSHRPASAYSGPSFMAMANGCCVFRFNFWSSRRAALPPTAPLRTVRESFQLTRLKPSERLVRDAAAEAAELGVQFPLTLWMKEFTVYCAARSAQHFWDYVMAAPSRLLSDGITTSDTYSSLGTPEIEQRSTTP